MKIEHPDKVVVLGGVEYDVVFASEVGDERRAELDLPARGTGVARASSASARTKQMLAPSRILCAVAASLIAPMCTRHGSPRAIMMRENWIYERSDDGGARFVLATRGDNPLVCFGIYPSTVRPGALDPTVKRVARFAKDNAFDSWTMLNVYPQISTNPKLINHTHREELKLKNEAHMARVIDGRPLTLLAACGGLISSRPCLRPLLQDIVAGTALAACRWVSLGAPTKEGHPRHPLYVRADVQLESFNIDEFVID